MIQFDELLNVLVCRSPLPGRWIGKRGKLGVGFRVKMIQEFESAVIIVNVSVDRFRIQFGWPWDESKALL